MTANPLKPVKRYRPGKAPVEEHSSEEEEIEDDNEQIAQEQERRRRQEEEAKRRQQKTQKAAPPPPKASSFPGGGGAAGRITKGVRDVQIEEEEDDDDDEGFVTEEEEESAPVSQKLSVPAAEEDEEESESESSEESSEEESSEDEQPKRMLLRPTFIKKDKRKENGPSVVDKPAIADSAADAEARRVQRQELANDLVREQLEKEAAARLAGKKAWDEDENVAAEEEALDDRDGLDPEAEYAAWKLRELKRIKRQREAIEEAEREREEIERRRNLNPEEREREDREFIEKQKEEKEASRGQTGYMRRYFHKGAFFRDDLEKEGLDKRDIMGARFADETSREVLPEYMQIRDMTKLGKKGRTRYKDLRSEDTGRWGQGFNDRPRRPRDENLAGITDERFLPDSHREGPGPTGANASAVRDRRRSFSRDRRDRRDQRDDDREYRKRSHSPGEERDKRRRVES